MLSEFFLEILLVSASLLHVLERMPQLLEESFFFDLLLKGFFILSLA